MKGLSLLTKSYFWISVIDEASIVQVIGIIMTMTIDKTLSFHSIMVYLPYLISVHSIMVYLPYLITHLFFSPATLPSAIVPYHQRQFTPPLENVENDKDEALPWRDSRKSWENSNISSEPIRNHNNSWRGTFDSDNGDRQRHRKRKSRQCYSNQLKSGLGKHKKILM